MFTGIIEAVGRVRSVEPAGDLLRLEVDAPGIAAGLELGDSVAVNGCCLTVSARGDDRLCFEAVRESMDRTNLGDLSAGKPVNLERALRADARLDGHIVQGHVDATGSVERFDRDGEDVRFHVACDPDFANLLVEKGSVAIDGVSLTVVGLREAGFDVALIPLTLRETSLGAREPGDRVNLEADILGKYVLRYLERVRPTETHSS